MKFSIFNFQFSSRRVRGGFTQHQFSTSKTNAGFTLLETIVALVLLVAASLGPITLASQAISVSKHSKNKIIALNLAQEGIEIIRQTRDNNLLFGYHWRNCTLLIPPAGGTCVLLNDNVFGSGSGYAVDIFTSGALPNSTGAPLWVLSSGALTYYSQQQSGTQSPFVRRVYISTPTSADVDMRVFSRVTWTESGRTNEVRLEDTLYNWE